MLTRDRVAVAVLASWPDNRVLHGGLGRFEIAHWAALTAVDKFDADRLHQAVPTDIAPGDA